MLKPRMSVSVSMIIILSLQRNWCSGRMKHLLVNVLDTQDTPPFSENGSEERGQDYQENLSYISSYEENLSGPSYEENLSVVSYEENLSPLNSIDHRLAIFTPLSKIWGHTRVVQTRVLSMSPFNRWLTAN